MEYVCFSMCSLQPGVKIQHEPPALTALEFPVSLRKGVQTIQSIPEDKDWPPRVLTAYKMSVWAQHVNFENELI